MKKMSMNEHVNEENEHVNEENEHVNEENEHVNEENEHVNLIEKIKEKYPKLNKTSIEILELIVRNQKVTQEEFSNELNKSRSTFYRNVEKLKNLNIVERVGSDKKGYWKIKL